jgi:hypothetical protein
VRNLPGSGFRPSQTEYGLDHTRGTHLSSERTRVPAAVPFFFCLSIRADRNRLPDDSTGQARREADMKQYLLSIYQPDGDPPAPEVLEPIMRDIRAVDDEMRAAGAWVFTGGLHPPASATVVRADGDGMLVTDGPFAEGKEHIGGFWIIRAPDLDAALGWASKAAAASTLPIEVRPMVDEAAD